MLRKIDWRQQAQDKCQSLAGGHAAVRRRAPPASDVSPPHSSLDSGF